MSTDSDLTYLDYLQSDDTKDDSNGMEVVDPTQLMLDPDLGSEGAVGTPSNASSLPAVEETAAKPHAPNKKDNKKENKKPTRKRSTKEQLYRNREAAIRSRAKKAATVAALKEKCESSERERENNRATVQELSEEVQGLRNQLFQIADQGCADQEVQQFVANIRGSRSMSQNPHLSAPNNYGSSPMIQHQSYQNIQPASGFDSTPMPRQSSISTIHNAYNSQNSSPISYGTVDPFSGSQNSSPAQYAFEPTPILRRNSFVDHKYQPFESENSSPMSYNPGSDPAVVSTQNLDVSGMLQYVSPQAPTPLQYSYPMQAMSDPQATMMQQPVLQDGIQGAPAYNSTGIDLGIDTGMIIGPQYDEGIDLGHIDSGIEIGMLQQPFEQGPDVQKE